MNNSKGQHRALIVVDYQNDFCDPKGTLYVPQGEKIKNYLIQKILVAKQKKHFVVASLDWHPSNHSSFKIWPPHGIMNTWGATMPLPEKYFDLLIKKGQHPTIDSYSAFLDHQKNSNGLHEWLQHKGVTIVEIVGLATDVCVSETIRDAIYLKYEVIVDLNGCRGMENKIILKPYLNKK